MMTIDDTPLGRSGHPQRYAGASPVITVGELRAKIHRVEKWIAAGRSVEVVEGTDRHLVMSLTPFNPRLHASVRAHNTRLGWKYDGDRAQLPSGQHVHVLRHERLSIPTRISHLLDYLSSPAAMRMAATYVAAQGRDVPLTHRRSSRATSSHRSVRG